MAKDQQTHRTVQEVSIPLMTNITFVIHRPKYGDRFELKLNMVQLLNNNEQFTTLSDEDF